MCIHCQPDRNGEQDQCVVNHRDDYTHDGERFHCPGYAIPRRPYPRRKASLRRRKCCSKDCEPHKAEEPNDVFTPVEYSAHTEEEKERCSGDAQDIHPAERLLECLAVCDWRS